MNRILRVLAVLVIGATLSSPGYADCEACGDICGGQYATACIYLDGALVHCAWENGTQWTLTSSGYKTTFKKC